MLLMWRKVVLLAGAIVCAGACAKDPIGASNADELTSVQVSLSGTSEDLSSGQIIAAKGLSLVHTAGAKLCVQPDQGADAMSGAVWMAPCSASGAQTFIRSNGYFATGGGGFVSGSRNTSSASVVLPATATAADRWFFYQNRLTVDISFDKLLYPTSDNASPTGYTASIINDANAQLSGWSLQMVPEDATGIQIWNSASPQGACLSNANSIPQMAPCVDGAAYQLWNLTNNVISNQNMCLSAGEQNSVLLTSCNTGDQNQQWALGSAGDIVNVPIFASHPYQVAPWCLMFDGADLTLVGNNKSDRFWTLGPYVKN